MRVVKGEKKLNLFADDVSVQLQGRQTFKLLLWIQEQHTVTALHQPRKTVGKNGALSIASCNKSCRGETTEKTEKHF